MSFQATPITSNSSADIELSSKRLRNHSLTQLAETFSSTQPPLHDAPYKSLPFGVRTSLGLTGLPPIAHKPAAPTSFKRRGPSADAGDVFVEPPSAIMAPARVIDASATRSGPDSRSGQFYDEYDLSSEDPRILQDVQRALRLKARREARLGSRSPVSAADKSLLRRHVSLSPQPFLPTSSPGKSSVSWDLDFGPSISADSIHPIPASLDNGATLDWSGFDHKTEGRWRLTASKKKSKDFVPPSTVLIDQQETANADKIARLKSVISPDTFRKAKIIGEQLSRRYQTLYKFIAEGIPLNVAEVARWHRGQGILIQTSLARTEPFVWLKHLDKRKSKPSDRSRWYLSSLIVEEYVQAQTRYDRRISEDFPMASVSSNSPSRHSPTSSHASSSQMLVPSPLKTPSKSGAIHLIPAINGLHAAGRHERNNFKAPLQIPRPRMSTEGTNDRTSFSDHFEGRPHVFSSPEPGIRVIASSDQSDREPDDTPSRIAFQVISPTSATTSADSSHHLPSARTAPLRTRKELDRVLSQHKLARTSLPSAHRTSVASEIQLQQEANEERAYQQKARLLEDILAHNQRIRQLLNRISNAVRDYDASQIHATSSLGTTPVSLPKELLEAFGHDPAAVTGATRKFRGWRAVDDIQHRLLRQREIFEAFLAQPGNDISLSQSVLDNPIASLVDCLDALENNRQKIGRRVRDVVESLKGVQKTHALVKREYKETMAHTSVVYPELSHIVALEESYKDQYQQFWEFGMDTLTFLLDTVTPFWRNYGKIIGEDVQDFLIVPLYRNEFTGELKRYPIKALPVRSLRRWSGLLLFFFLSVSMAVLQARAAISSSIHYRLSMIPYDSLRWTVLPFFWIGIVIQWLTVTIEFVIVLTQVGVLVWWTGWSVGLFT